MKGKLPAWLRGAFVRNGPGTFKGVKCDPRLLNETLAYVRLNML